MKIKRCVQLLTVLLALLLCAGCGDTEEVETALVIIAGRHANANMYTEEMLKRAEDLIWDSFVEDSSPDGRTATAQLAVIVSDGNPTKAKITMDGGDNSLTCSAPNRSLLKEGETAIVDNVISFLRSDGLKADDPEVDLLGALREAQKELASYPDAEHRILILDTGITTAGQLDMQYIDILESECSDIVEEIADGIPDLEGAKVTFLNLGNVAGDQARLNSTSAEDKLEELWTAIIERANGKLEEIRFSPQEGEPMLYNGEDSADGYAYVKPVLLTTEEERKFVPEPFVLRTEGEKSAEIPADEPTLEVLLPESYLGFQPGTAEFRDENQVLQVLDTLRGPFEDFLNDEAQYSIYVVGSIAKTAPDKNQRTDPVSHDRAQKVTDLLVNQLKVPRERIIPIDAGVTKFTWRGKNEKDEFADGSTTADPAIQMKNRVVAIFGENSVDLVQELRKEGYIS